ncbi:MAG TPA: LysM peptidoglycan-binding domain-containing protein [Bacillales bacterium]|nr:LysM peptidoglycan-binding domain-containing protein [Bacillales bacterium]
MQENHDSFDQAEILRERMEENQSETSGLPPRSEVHRKKDKKVNYRFRFPLIRLLVLTFILIVCIVASYNLWKDHIQLTNASETKNEIKNNSNIDVFEMKEDGVEEGGTVEEIQDEHKVAQPTETIPAPIEETTTEVKEIEATPVQTAKVLHHKVKAGETLYRISMKYYKSRTGEEIIKKANGLDANGTVMTGQILKIPIK